MGLVRRSDGIDFGDASIKNAFDDVKENDKEMYKHLERELNDVLENFFCGIQIPKKLFPDRFKHLKNLWKYNLPDAWRLLYTIKSLNKVEVVAVILDWMGHKDYDRLFGY